MREVLKFTSNQYLKAEELLNAHCKGEGKNIIYIQVLSADVIYAIVEDSKETELLEENKKLTEQVEDLKKSGIEWHYMVKDPTDFPKPQTSVIVVYRNKCDGYLWEPTFGMVDTNNKWCGMSSFDNNYHFVVKWAYIPS